MKETKQTNMNFENERLLHPLNEASTSSQSVKYPEIPNSINVVSNSLDVNISSQLITERQESNNKNENILKEIMISVLSSSFALLCIFLIETINIIMMGNTKNASLNLDSVGLGNIFLNFAGVLIAFGILGGMDTMGSHCYGYQNYELLGIFTIRTRIILNGLFFLFTVPCCLFCYKILTFINIYEPLAENSYYYIIGMLPTILLTYNFNLNIRYVQVMQYYFYPSLIAITAMLLHLLICYFNVMVLELDLLGTCISSFVTMSYCLIMSIYYILSANPCPESLFFKPPTRTYELKEFYEYLKLCIYSGIQTYGDYIGYEVVCFMCSYLSQSSMATTLIVLNYANLIGYIYVGFSFPLAHFVGYYLGKRDYSMYKHCVFIFTWINIVSALILGSTVLFFPKEISALYTNDPETLEKSSHIFKIWTIGVVSDIFNIMLQAILRGAGKQHITSIWNLVMSIVWMIPLSYYLCFILKWDVFGIWIGCISYVVILTSVNTIYYFMLDVEEASAIIYAQINEENVATNMNYSPIKDIE